MIHVKFSSPALMGQPVRMTVTQGRVSRSLGVEAFGVAKALPPLGNAGGATLTISARRGQQQIAPEGIVFFAEVSGFDAQKPTDGKVYDPTLHDIAYTWSFGDPGDYAAPENMLPEWRNRNLGYGPFPAHVFTRPGTYAVTCTASERSSGKTATATLQVTVQDPETVFSAATTIVCAADGDYSGAPAHDAANRVTTFDAALARLRSRKSAGQSCRVLFRAGDVFTMNSNTYLGSSYHNVHFSAFGTGRATVRAMSNGSVFQVWSGLITSGASISRIAVIGPWDSTTETLDPAYPAGAKRPTAFDVSGGFATFHDCTSTGMFQNCYAGKEPGTTAIFSECRATNWEDYGMYVAGDMAAAGYVAALGCRFAQDPRALQGGNGKSTTDLGNRHGAVRLHASAYVYIDALDGFSRNGWTIVNNTPVDQNIIRDHRNHPGSRAFFSRIMGEGGWQGYGNGSASPDQSGEGGFHNPCNAVLDKFIFMGSARTVGHLGICAGAFTARNGILHRPNVGTGADAFGRSLKIGDADLGDFSEANRSEPVRIYNVTIVNELDNIQQARNARGGTGWDAVEIVPGVHDAGVVQIGNLVVHRPNFTDGIVADAPLDDARLGLAPRYLGYDWKTHVNGQGKPLITDNGPFDTSHATPANPWSLWRPAAGSPAIGSATGMVAHDDLLGRVRPAQASRGAVEPA